MIETSLPDGSPATLRTLSFSYPDTASLDNFRFWRKQTAPLQMSAKAPKDKVLGSGTGRAASKLWPDALYSACQIQPDASVAFGIEVTEKVEIPLQSRNEP